MENQVIKHETGHLMVRRALAALCAAIIGVGAAAAAPAPQASAATPKWSSLSDTLKRSSYGFFIWRAEHGSSQLERDSAADAAQMLMTSALPVKKDIGGKGDATSLENMINGAKAVVGVNEFRSSLTNEPCRTDLPEGKGRKCEDPNKRLAPLTVSDTFMAAAQANANYSDTVLGHAGWNQDFDSKYYTIWNTAENAAWNMSVFASGNRVQAIGQWYSEKATYDQGSKDYSATGHYVNLTSDKYVSTGFGICTRGTRYPVTFVQDYAQAAMHNSYTQSADSYLNEVLSYAAMVAEPQSMYRLYNPNSGEHFYTKEAGERDILVSKGWKYEGVGWTAPSVSGMPVYRLYNALAGDHHYTMNEAERDMLWKSGWNYEGIGWYSAENTGRVPLLREYNPYAWTGTHNYTLNANEDKMLQGQGWRSEGLAWYAVHA
ncbi:MAG: CAP domain-containing protein [Bifidobacteriaceae bacterium]|nr:CAP domain-containing protein [Bifidobacteriaceae bacterium]